jgi:hypothetical protein
MTNCAIWGVEATEITLDGGTDAKAFESPRAGGRYWISGTAVATLGSLTIAEKVKLTNQIVDANRTHGTLLRIDSNVLQNARMDRALTVAERQDRLLQYLETKPKHIAQGVPIRGIVTPEHQLAEHELLARTASTDTGEYHYLIDQCAAIGLVETRGNTVRLSAKGHEYVQSLKSNIINSAQAFVAMWFDDSMTEIFENAIVPAVHETGYRAFRVDRKEHVNKIDDEIVAEIRRSRFVIADFTSDPDKPRGGVYFEAGFAHGLNIPVIWTCRKDLIDSVHFDTRQFNHIVWSSPEELCNALKKRIGAVIGQGPVNNADNPAN